MKDNYQIQAGQAKQLFLTYDQQELIRRCRLQFDETYLYTKLFADSYRIERHTGNMQRQVRGQWKDGNSFAEVMTLLDWLCDSKPDRYIAHKWVNIVTAGHSFHRDLQHSDTDPAAALFDSAPEAFAQACKALGASAASGGDISFVFPVVEDLQIMLQLWRGDEEFPPKLCVFWDSNVLQYLRYETTWYTVGLLKTRIREKMNEIR